MKYDATSEHAIKVVEEYKKGKATIQDVRKAATNVAWAANAYPSDKYKHDESAATLVTQRQTMTIFTNQTINPNCKHSNYMLTEQAFGAWFFVKDQSLPDDFDWFVKECDRIRAGVITWLDAHPKRMSQFAECAGIRIEVQRYENGSYGTHIYVTPTYGLIETQQTAKRIASKD